jgi:hypothetical protein
MERVKSKLDQVLKQTLDKLTDQEELDVLVYPQQPGGEFEQFLSGRKNEGWLDYNVLHLANCVVIKASKKIILEIAARDDVSRLTINPRFTAH